MKSNNELVSVIVPVFNCEKYLAEAIESILEQTYKHFEIIVVNDGSTDNTEKVAEKYSNHIKYYYQVNKGIGPARNLGIDNSSGNYLSFLDADDLYIEDKLEKQLGVIISNPETDIVYGHVEQFLSPEIYEELEKKYKCPKTPMPGELASTMFVSKKKFFEVGYFARKMSVGVDVDWHLRAKENNLRILTLKDTLLKRRIHKTNTGIVSKNKRVDYLRYLKQSIDRRRKKPV